MLEKLPLLVFVVDDEQVIATTLAMILKNSGYRAVAYASAEAAMKAAEAESPSLLITDVNMPGMNGIDLAIRFKTLYPGCKLLLFSGHLATVGLLQAARELGHDFEVMAKPVHPKDLLAAIEKL
jgi:FixJ family two-component response regulator